MNFVDIIEYIGTFAFAISGVRLAAAKQFDWFGAYSVGLVTAIGGGTLRDILLGATPFWMTEPSYMIFTALALFWVVFFGTGEKNHYIDTTFLIFDALGLALFTVVGVEKALQYNYPVWVAIIMGCITGVFGGICRDVLVGQIPLIFRKEIYAVASAIGGLAYGVGRLLHFPALTNELICGISILVIRYFAVKYKISLPVLKGEENE